MDIPREASWLVARTRGGWQWVLAATGMLEFALPFAALLPRATKRRSAPLVGISIVVLLGHYLDVYWLVMPAPDAQANPVPMRVPWMELGAVLLLGGAWLAYYLWQLGRAPLLPVGDPFLGDLREEPHYD